MFQITDWHKRPKDQRVDGQANKVHANMTAVTNRTTSNKATGLESVQLSNSLISALIQQEVAKCIGGMGSNILNLVNLMDSIGISTIML